MPIQKFQVKKSEQEEWLLLLKKIEVQDYQVVFDFPDALADHASGQCLNLQRLCQMPIVKLLLTPSNLALVY